MSTKKIIEYRALYKSTKATTLKELKSSYRTFMKDIHPDTIQDDAERLAAEEKSTEIIAAYHFLVSIAPETLEKDKAEYTRITSTTNLAEGTNLYYTNARFDTRFGTKTTTDLTLGYQFTKQLKLTVGSNNMFNIYPDQQDEQGNTEAGGYWDAVQMGFNGAYYYARLGFTF